MKRITAEEALAKVGRKTKYAPLKNEILDLEPGEAMELEFSDFAPSAISQITSSVARQDATRKFSVRRRRDGEGCFVICSTRND
jgi:hypothetical protein